jgi:hypothetical protein
MSHQPSGWVEHPDPELADFRRRVKAGLVCEREGVFETATGAEREWHCADDAVACLVPERTLTCEYHLEEYLDDLPEHHFNWPHP